MQTAHWMCRFRFPVGPFKLDSSPLGSDCPGVKAASVKLVTWQHLCAQDFCMKLYVCL